MCFSPARSKDISVNTFSVASLIPTVFFQTTNQRDIKVASAC
jgi:hypothetical protein